jgi:hypothetical protein
VASRVIVPNKFHLPPVFKNTAGKLQKAGRGRGDFSVSVASAFANDWATFYADIEPY